jgi:hypothetical protein
LASRVRSIGSIRASSAPSRFAAVVRAQKLNLNMNCICRAVPVP